MRENLSSFLSAIQRTVRVSTDQHVYVCRSLQINIATCISSNPNNISRYFPLIGDEIVDGEGLNYSGYIFSVFFHFFLGILRWVPNDALQNYKRFSYTGAPLSNTLWRRRSNKDQSSRNVSVLSDMTSKIWADFDKDWHKIGILQ